MMLRRSALLLVCLLLVGCGHAKYGECQKCGALYGVRGGNLPYQGSACPKCGGHIWYPKYKSADYYRFKREYGGTED